MTYRHLGYTKRDWKLLTRGVVDPTVYFVAMGLIISASSPLLYQQRLHHDQREAIAWMKRLHACATAYAATHPVQGFPAQLDLLGPRETKCLDPLSPEKEKSGYTFTYTSSAPDGNGKVETHFVAARPINRGRPSQRSFYMDTTGVIHATGEDRDATSQDPAVQ